MEAWLPDGVILTCNFPTISTHRFQDLVVSPCLYLEKGEIIECTNSSVWELNE